MLELKNQKNILGYQVYLRFRISQHARDALKFSIHYFYFLDLLYGRKEVMKKVMNLS